MLRKTFIALFTLLAASAAARAQVTFSPFVIDEVDTVQDGGNDRQFVELFNGSAAAIDLSQYSLGFYDGAAANNAAYMIVQLNGSIAAGGFYVVGDAKVSNVNQTIADGSIKTGVDAIILYHNNVLNPIAPTVPVTTDLLNFTDALVYGQNQTPDLDLLAATGEGAVQYNENFGPTLGGPGAGAATLSRVNGSDAIPFEIGTPTPGAVNNIVVPVSAVIPVPEPTSATLLGVVGAVGLLRRRR